MELQYNTAAIKAILYNWKYKILLFVMLCMLLSVAVVYIMPKQYKSSTTVLPANPKVIDKNFLYGNNILELNSSYGMEEDLDRLLTTLRLSSNFSTLVDSFKLIQHYTIANTTTAKANAMEQLVQNSTITKTDNGAIQINIWDTNAELAANIANTLVSITEQKTNANNQSINAAYLTTLQQQLLQTKTQLQQLETNADAAIVKDAQRKAYLTAIEKDAYTIAQLQTSINTKVPCLIVLEKAYSSQKADRPKLLYWLLITGIASSLFAIACIVLYTYRRTA